MFDIPVPYFVNQKAIDDAIEAGVEAYRNGEETFYIDEEKAMYLSESDWDYIANEIMRRV